MSEHWADQIVNSVVPLSVIEPHQRNYRQHPEEQIAQLKSSHERFQQYRSVVLWERPGGKYIQVAGHGIVEAMRERGVSSVRADILPVHTPESEVDAILVADNNIALQSVDDEAILAQLLQEQQDAGFDLASLGSDEETLRQMLESLGDEYLENDEERQEKPVTFKEYDETIADDLDTELCGQCGKLCLKSGGQK